MLGTWSLSTYDPLGRGAKLALVHRARVVPTNRPVPAAFRPMFATCPGDPGACAKALNCQRTVWVQPTLAPGLASSLAILAIAS